MGKWERGEEEREEAWIEEVGLRCSPEFGNHLSSRLPVHADVSSLGVSKVTTTDEEGRLLR